MSEFFTSQTAVDRETILDALTLAVRNGRLRFLEIGVFGGSTARGVQEWCAKRGVALEYCGIDSGQHPNLTGLNGLVSPFPEAKFIIGDSAEVWEQVPYGFDAVLIDGCHCVNHVILDTIHYSPMVYDGGYIIYHDTAPHVQHTMRDPHGPNTEWFHNSVTHGLLKIGWPFPGWKLVADKYDPEAKFGGCRVYQKV